jgi:CheY-like chemotaxis protein
MTGAQKTVLIVDDDADVRDYFSTFYADNGFAVETAVDGNEALAKVEAGAPDLITLDITMPEKSGVRFYREMKEDESRKGTPIIIITGVAKEFESFISSRRQVPPPEGYLSKPVDLDELLQLSNSLMD